MLKRLRLTLPVIALLSSAALGHHSPSAFDTTGEVIVEGTLAKVDWANPHVYLTVETAGPEGQRVLQQVESVSVAVAQATGLKREFLTLGSTVIVHAYPNRRGPGYTVLGTDITTSDGNVYPLRAGRGSRPPAVTVPATGLAGNWAPRGNPQLMSIVHGWPLTDKARAALAAVFSGRTQLSVGCTAIPLPMLTLLPLLRTVEVHDDRVVMKIDSDGVDATRTVRLDLAEHPANVGPSLFGHSIGRWEGATLVIDTVAFTPHDIGIGFGVPSGASKHLTERLTLAADGLQLRYELTVEDPEYLAAPATYTAMWDHRPDLGFSDTACDPQNSERFREE
ncbi:MAG TPA: DUF6152 family protein [Gammaproteobacteria bacterium]|nr:DUF6152 family protein [Gammaproteobacteria bacterium]